MGRGLGKTQEKILEALDKGYMRATPIARYVWGEKAFYRGRRGWYIHNDYSAKLRDALKRLERRKLIIRIEKGVYLKTDNSDKIKSYVGMRITMIRRKMDKLDREHERLQDIYLGYSISIK